MIVKGSAGADGSRAGEHPTVAMATHARIRHGARKNGLKISVIFSIILGV
jgi:hypothetical protein